MCLDVSGVCLVTVVFHVSVYCVFRFVLLCEDIWVLCLYVVVCAACSV